MIVMNGKGVCGGIAHGSICFYRRSSRQVTRHHISNVQSEIERFEKAKKSACAQLDKLHEKALAEVGEQGALLFEIHQMMLEDLDYCEAIINIITAQEVNGEYAVATTADNFAKMFSEMDDTYMQARAADVHDVSERLLNVLMGTESGGITSDVPVIVAADDLAPSETVQLDKSKILAFVTRSGSANSHTAILARTMGIPAIIGVGDALTDNFDGMEAFVDGSAGVVYIQPDAQTIISLHEKHAVAERNKSMLLELKGKPNISLDGQKMMVYANIGSPSDMGAVLKNDAGGIGLFRSEFLYLESSDYPTEETLFTAYRQVAESMAGKRVVIRTLDIGADKQAAYFELPHEENPAMGMRAIRICLTRKDIFRTQLRAIYRASAYGKIAIMFPMITSVKEVKEIKEIVSEVRESLRSDGIAFSNEVELGIMVETPAAALISDRLASEVDFFSAGTNDLTQYTLAVDRQNPNLDLFYNAHHPAVLRLLKMTADNAHKHGIWMGICGELAGDLSLTETFLSIGIDELSVSPSQVLDLRQKIRATDVSKIRQTILDELLG